MNHFVLVRRALSMSTLSKYCSYFLIHNHFVTGILGGRYKMPMHKYSKICFKPIT